MIITKGYPPNINDIAKVLPKARRPGVIFAYGDFIFVPSGKEISHPLKVHEAVHGIRQKEIGIEFWWKRYLEDKAFRYNEELLAHRAEYQALVKDVPSKNFRKATLRMVAKKLAAPLYGCDATWKKAAKDIMEGIQE